MPGLDLFASSDPDGPFHDMDLGIKETTTTAPTLAPIQAPPVILPLPGQSVDRLCVDIKHSQGPMNLLSDPDQGVEVTGQYEMEKAQFSWIEVTFKNLQLQVRASPEHVVVIRNRRSSVYKWKETLFSVMPGEQSETQTMSWTSQPRPQQEFLRTRGQRPPTPTPAAKAPCRRLQACRPLRTLDFSTASR